MPSPEGKERPASETNNAHETSPSPTSTTRPLFSFGVIADCQYADADDAFNFHKTSLRRYRNSLKILEEAIQSWNDLIGEEEEGGGDVTNSNAASPSPSGRSSFKFVAQLGDLLDGKAKAQKGGADEALQSGMWQTRTHT